MVEVQPLSKDGLTVLGLQQQSDYYTLGSH